MLVRSAGRRQRRHNSQHLAASFAQLHLPWLAPAQLRWNALHTPTTSPNARSTTRRHSTRATPNGQSRGLATAVDHLSVRSDGHGLPAAYGPGLRKSTHDQRPYPDPAPAGRGFPGLHRNIQPVIINTPMRTPQLANVKLGSQFITASETLLHLRTSLEVGRRDRAAVIVHRLAETCSPKAGELLQAHTMYLEDGLKRLMAHGRDSPQSQVLLREMQRWFEVEIRDKGVQLDEKVIVVMLRAVIRALDGARRDRSIRRYTELSEKLGEETLLAVLESDDYDDVEFGILERATEDYYVDAPDAELATAPDAEQVQTLPTMPTGLDGREKIDLGSIPEVVVTEQKGDGLHSVKQIMNIFTDLPPLSVDHTAEDQRARAEERQLELESASLEVAMRRWRQAEEDLRAMGVNSSMQSKPINAMMWEWRQGLLKALEQEHAECKKELKLEGGKESDRRLYGTWFELPRLPLDKIAGITIMVVMTSMAQGKAKFSDKYETESKLVTLIRAISDNLEAEAKTPSSVQSKSWHRKSQKASAPRTRKRAVRTLQTKDEEETTNPKPKSKRAIQQSLIDEQEWPVATKTKFGAMLLSKLIETAKILVERSDPRSGEVVKAKQPAFTHKIQFLRGKRFGVVVPNSALVDKLRKDPVGDLIVKRMPMVYPPKVWTGWDKGGYLNTRTPILRLPHGGDKDGKRYFKWANEAGNLGPVYDGLNALSGVPWRIHPGVFKVQLEAWNTGEEIANFAPLNPDHVLPPEPASVDDQTDKFARMQWLAEVKAVTNKIKGLHSKRCFQNFQLEIARTVVNETLYFPHNLDFRGRAYPIPPYLNHMGADNVRGLLVFADGKELGERGLRWLKTHLATVAGLDKASMDEREAYTMEHLDDIYDSVRDPLGGRRWWLESEDAWQTLAACFELTQALDSPDPTKFVSHLPIQQDGTCNGLQHYAALGGDKAGAAQVNLEPGDRPADVYTAVADAVRAEVDKDAASGNPVALTLQGRLTRKCVKQPVMTNVYGVTFYGAKAQVRKQLEVVFPEVQSFGEVNLGNMSHYVATKIFKSLGTMFTGAQLIQGWLGQCADRISTSLNPTEIDELKRQQASAGPRPKKAKKAKAVKPKKAKKAKKLKKGEVAPAEEEVLAEEELKPLDAVASTEEAMLTGAPTDVVRKSAKPLFRSLVVWTTPLNLPVVQPYRTSKSRSVPTAMQAVNITDPSFDDPVSKRKQLQAFPPNFIHSLDATHMLLSAAKCKENGMTFASIHDSFWTHACDVDAMSEYLRDAFIEMHQGDIVAKLREEFTIRYKDYMYLAPVIASSKVGAAVIARRAELKKDTSVSASELTLESERMRLLASEDPEEVAKGKAMVTPGSIFLSEADPAAFAPPVEMNGYKLGEIPGEGRPVESSEIDASDADPEHLPEDLPEAQLDETSEVETASDKTHDATESKPSKAAAQKKIFVWLPLTFPEVPAKGDFDVSKLKESRYFFH